MKRIITFFVIGGFVLSNVAFAQTPLEQYLGDTADGRLLVEVTLPADAQVRQTVWSRLWSLLGVRSRTSVLPAPGTQFSVQSSAYASSPYQTDSTPCITAAGTRVREGVVATNFLPLGTILEINGERFIVEDRMNARYGGYYLDIWFPSTSSALEFGRRQLDIVIIGYGKPGDEVRPQATPSPEVAEEPSLWERTVITLSSVGRLLGVRTATDVNRFDVDCFAEEAINPAGPSN